MSPNPVFFSIQGEGYLTGVPMIFIRLAGCDCNCSGCDTDYSKDSEMEIETLSSYSCNHPDVNHVWITGGEPTLQPKVEELIRRFRSTGMTVCLATHRNEKMGATFVSFSPHTQKDHNQYASEIKLIPNLNGFDAEKYYKDNISKYSRWYIQPQPGEEKEAVDLVMKYPADLKLSLQTHKYLNML